LRLLQDLRRQCSTHRSPDRRSPRRSQLPRTITQELAPRVVYTAPGRHRPKTLSEEEYKAIGAQYGAINRTPGVTPGLPLGLPENATTVRVQDGKTLTTHGPFVETKEATGY
jgi:hypothetical protein